MRFTAAADQKITLASGLLDRVRFPPFEVKQARALLREVKLLALPKIRPAPEPADERQIPLPISVEPTRALFRCPKAYGVDESACLRRQLTGDKTTLDADDPTVDREVARHRSKRGRDCPDGGTPFCRSEDCDTGRALRASTGWVPTKRTSADPGPKVPKARP